MNVVLIVEDEIIEQDFLKTIVQDKLHPEDKLLTCDSGVQAIQLAKKYRPNIIIIDLILPEVHGLTAIQEIRKFMPNACITILSAYSNFSYAQKALSLRVFEYLLKPVKPTVLKDIFSKMLQSVSNDHALVDNIPKEKNIETKDEPQHSIEESIKYIKEHFREKLTLEIIASKVFMNPKYFSRIFKKEMDVTFTKYIIQLKIQYACRLLKTTNYQVYRISTECGFADPSYFNRVFCAQMNITPQKYRKMHMR